MCENSLFSTFYLDLVLLSFFFANKCFIFMQFRFRCTDLDEIRLADLDFSFFKMTQIGGTGSSPAPAPLPGDVHGSRCTCHSS